jgi:CRP-like cAMP-binding protein
MPRIRRAPPTGNALLDRIPSAERGNVLEACELVELVPNAVLDEPGAPVAHAYFPVASVISSLLPMHAGHCIEVTLTGPEGLHGAAAGRGSMLSSVRAQVHVPGPAWRVRTPEFRANLAAHRAFSATVDGYLTALLAQLARAAACNRFHRVEQRLARWILMSADRVRSGRFAMTHEMVANALGVRRVGVTNAAGHLQRLKVIAYHRGIVEVLDRGGLQSASCECYRADLDAYARALPSRGLRSRTGSRAGPQ